MPTAKAARAGHRVFLILGIVFLLVALAPKFVGLGFNRTFLYLALAFLLLSSALGRHSRSRANSSADQDCP